MKFFDFGQEAVGFIAIGQIATGVIAIGQMATGVIAIGQVARGFVAIGQGSVGLVAVGMGAVGVYWAGAMIGVGGQGFGLVVPLAPSLGPKLALPSTATWAELEARGEGWADAALGADGALEIPADVRIDARLRRALKGDPAGKVVVHVGRVGDTLVVDRVQRVPAPRWTQIGWYTTWAIQWALLVGVAVFFAAIVVFPLFSALVLGRPVAL